MIIRKLGGSMSNISKQTLTHSNTAKIVDMYSVVQTYSVTVE